jgi:hypothetical protein
MVVVAVVDVVSAVAGCVPREQRPEHIDGAAADVNARIVVVPDLA